MLALKDGFYSFDFDSGKAELIVKPVETQANSDLRFNDGKCDPQYVFFTFREDKERKRT